MAKQIAFSEDARRRLKVGIDTLAKAGATTLGPKGRNVALDKKFGAPTITHDGVTVAKEIELEDPYENMGAQLLKEAATKTNDTALRRYLCLIPRRPGKTWPISNRRIRFCCRARFEAATAIMPDHNVARITDISDEIGLLKISFDSMPDSNLSDSESIKL